MINNICRRHHLIFLAMLGIFIFILYAPATNGPYVLDSRYHIQDNSTIKIDHLNFTSLEKITSTYPSRPISMLTLALNHYIFGDSKRHFKGVNIILHILCAFCIYYFTCTLLKTYSSTKKIIVSENKIALIAGITTIVWATHPIQVSTAAYTIQRMTILFSLFSLLSMTFYTQARLIHINTGRIQKKLYTYSALLLFLSFLSKEAGAITLVYFALLEIFILNDFSNNTVKYKAVIVTGVSICILTLILISNTHMVTSYETRNFNINERLLTESRVLFVYLYKILFPFTSNFSVFYDDFSISKNITFPISTLYSITGLSITCVLTVLLGYKKPVLFFGICFFFCSHLIESTVIPLEIAFEHRNYLGLFGLVISLVYTLFSIDYKNNYLIYALLIALISTNLYISHQQIDTWSSDENFYSRNIENSPLSERANNRYARFLISNKPERKEDIIEHLKKAKDLNIKDIYSLVLLAKDYSSSENESEIYLNEIIERLKRKKIYDLDFYEVINLEDCFNKKTCTINKNSMLRVFHSILNNKTTSNSRHSTLSMTMANHIIYVLGDCKSGIEISNAAYKLNKNDFITKSWIKNNAYCDSLKKP